MILEGNGLCISELYRHLFEEFGLAKLYFDISDKTLSFKVDTERLDEMDRKYIISRHHIRFDDDYYR
jgi:hypothetical protein